MQKVTELRVSVKRIGTATYVTQKGGIAFKRMMAFQTMVRVPTDRFLVSEEAVRVLDTKE